MTNKLKATIAERALALRLRIKYERLGSLAGHAEMYFPKENFTIEEIDAWLLRMRKDMASHFEIEAPMSAMEKLEKANAATAFDRRVEKAVAEEAAPKIKLTKTEKRFPVDVRLALFEEKKAAALAAQAKKEEPKQ